MHPLDVRTRQRIVRILCDIDGPFERRGWQLEEFFRSAGWRDVPSYDGSARVRWATDVLDERADDLAATAQVLGRLCDPLEYEDGAEAAGVVRAAVNTVVEPEGLVVSLVGGRPVVAELAVDGSATRHAAPSDLERRLSQLVQNRKAVELLLARAAETEICEGNGAYVFAVIGIGSFIEGLLYSVLIERDVELRDHGVARANGRRQPMSRVSLNELIDIAHGKGWVQVDARDFLNTVRDYRNFVHPRQQLERELTPDRDTVMMCWGPVHAVLNDLEAALLGESGP